MLILIPAAKRHKYPPSGKYQKQSGNSPSGHKNLPVRLYYPNNAIFVMKTTINFSQNFTRKNHLRQINPLKMKKLSTLAISLLLVVFATANPVTIEKARLVADNYFRHYSGKSELTLKESSVIEYKGTITCFIFNYEGGGFVVVSADDAAVPVLAQSNTGNFPAEFSQPNLKYWFDGYNQEIKGAVDSRLSNEYTIGSWNKLLNNNFDRGTNDVDPLVTTSWDQGAWYNYYCPAASGGQGGHVWAGCVATAMGQIMKFHNFPEQGVLSHSYTHPTYGQQTANFGATTYNWAQMPTQATSSNYQSIATLLYHNGVAVDMNYGIDGSGAQSSDVPWALNTYFNYDPSTISLVYKADYSLTEWKNILIEDLTASRPIYYAGDDGSSGHAWVCDGYRSSDSKFHMNWGWSGSGNGYFTIGALNPPGYSPNQNNHAVIGIQPYNPDLIVRITNMGPQQIVPYRSAFDINCSVEKGTATTVNLYIDDNIVYTSAQASFVYSWPTAAYALGSHTVKVVALNETDTVYHQVSVGLSEWIPQASGFETQSRGIFYLHAVDSLVAWAVGYDGSGGSATTNDFTKTVDGGTTWVPGDILGGSTYGIGNICALNGDTAFAAVYNGAGNQDNNCGIYKTMDGGSTWTHLTGALQGSASFADNVYFWNENEGMCHGDTRDNYFEIYTTSDGGATWTRVPKANIGGGANPASGEGGWTSVIEATGDSTIMFGSNKAKLYISHDRGYTWTISATGITPSTNGGINVIAFKDKMHGLVAQTATTVVVKETSDGGATWQTVTPTGPFFTNDISFVPGTENTYVSTGAAEGAYGASFSEDGGHSWTLFEGTDQSQFLACDFASNSCGWAGGFNTSTTEGGMFKYVGILTPAGTVLATVTNVTALVYGNIVSLSWTAPSGTGNLLNYNIYRNDTLIGTAPSGQTEYEDLNVANGPQNYCVTAVYDLGKSEPVCTIAWIVVSTEEPAGNALRVYPNPATGYIMVESPENISQVKIMNLVGKEIYRNKVAGNSLKIATGDFKPGMYILQVTGNGKISTRKVTIR